MNILYSILFLLLLHSFLLCSCGGPDKLLKRADGALAIGEYAEAAALYKKAYTRTSPKDREKRGMVSLKMGNAYQRYGNYSRALGGYRNAVRYACKDSLVFLYLADMLRQTGDFKSAAKNYEIYLSYVPGDSLAMQRLYACRQWPSMVETGSLYVVKLEKLFNGSRADYSPAFMGVDAEQIYFTSNRPSVTGSDYSGVTALKNCDLMFSKKDEKGNWQIPELVEGGVNSEFDEGACSFSQDGKVMYMTVCRSDPQYPRMAEIWVSNRTDASWGKAQQLKITADTLSSYAHPALSPNGRWLYFVSDMPGGMGGLDLWRAELNGNEVVSVENLGADINSEGNECFPSFRPNGELYFSSTGHSSFGGLDIYRAVEDTLKRKWTLTHLPPPMNSFADDFGMTFEGHRNKGYFSSNRTTGGRGWDKIFSFEYPEVLQTVKGWVYEQDGYELPEAVVYMIGNDGTNLKLPVLSDGSFEHPLTPGVEYLFLATCKGYLNVKGELKADSAEIEYQHVLQFPLPSVGIPVLVRNVFYEFDKADLTENSIEALNRLLKMLNENPNVTIELAAHCDFRGNDLYNMNLSQKRAESVVAYLTSHGIEAERLREVHPRR